MGRRAGAGPLIHLDTNIALWSHGRRADRISSAALRLIERGPCQVSPMVVLELEILHEIGRLGPQPDHVLADLAQHLELTVSEAPFDRVVGAARTFAWTRDPFDRLIVANAMADGARLLTADETILANFSGAVW
jgi:PIN domain nuclease of toxin-antitoxin system